MKSFKQFLRTDNLVFGVAFALILSIAVYAIFLLLTSFFPQIFNNRFLRKESLAIISIFVNLVPFRIYMAGLRLEKTGRGVLVSMFVQTILYFVFLHQS